MESTILELNDTVAQLKRMVEELTNKLRYTRSCVEFLEDTTNKLQVQNNEMTTKMAEMQKQLDETHTTNLNAYIHREFTDACETNNAARLENIMSHPDFKTGMAKYNYKQLHNMYVSYEVGDLIRLMRRRYDVGGLDIYCDSMGRYRITYY